MSKNWTTENSLVWNSINDIILKTRKGSNEDHVEFIHVCSYTYSNMMKTNSLIVYYVKCTLDIEIILAYQKRCLGL